MSEINLAIKTVEVKTHIKKFFLISISIFGVIFILSAIATGVSYYLKNKIDSLEKQEAGLKNEINNLLPKKSKVMLLQDRIVNINKVLNTRKQLNEKVSFIFDLIPPEMNIESLSVFGESATIPLTSGSLFAVDQLFNKATNISKENDFVKKISVSSLGLDSNSKYTLNMIVNFSK